MRRFYRHFFREQVRERFSVDGDPLDRIFRATKLVTDQTFRHCLRRRSNPRLRHLTARYSARFPTQQTFDLPRPVNIAALLCGNEVQLVYCPA
jgi:hypothetical protein